MYLSMDHTQVLAFFFCGLWLVPFAFFISLSANDLVLPTMAGQNPGKSTMYILFCIQVHNLKQTMYKCLNLKYVNSNG